MIREEVFRYGESSRGFGMLTLPVNIDHAPVVVMFNAGLTYREGPYRLNVLLARMMAKHGYIAIRVDLSGKGDTPPREGLTNRESVAEDWKFINDRIKTRFPDSKLILMGLCSGADNAIKVAATKPHVHGMILLDPVVPPDEGYVKRAVREALSIPYNWLRSPKVLYRYIKDKVMSSGSDEEKIDLRDLPTEDETRKSLEYLVKLDGRVLAVFTHSATKYYNMKGQMVRALNLHGLDASCEEECWPWMRHLYVAQLHRDMLIKRVEEWASKHSELFRKKSEV